MVCVPVSHKIVSAEINSFQSNYLSIYTSRNHTLGRLAQLLGQNRPQNACRQLDYGLL